MNWSAKTPLKLFTEKLEILCFYKKKQKNFMVTGWGSPASRLQSHYQETAYYLPFHSLTRSSWYSIDRTWKDERLSPLSPLWNMGPLDCKSSALTTRPLFHKTSLASTKINVCAF